MMQMIFKSLLRYLAQRRTSLIDTFSLEPVRIVSEDRSILEGMVLPYFADDQTVQKILFVGCAAYTKSYENIFRDKEYWTIDPKRVKKKYGSTRHIVDSITKIDRYIARDYFHVIIMNGVIGYG